ncbi:MAG: transcriptional regulator [Nanoarchaeota archaeon]|nr:transcriptional regulator [Nanoarchaeota archaeon]
MKKVMPQEIELWYLIPAIRRELAKIFINEYGFSQKKSAQILGITEAAISQYLSSKRANEIKFSAREIEEIKKTAKKIVNNEKESMKFLYNLSTIFRGSKIICKLHRSKDKSIDKNCKICSTDKKFI